MAITIRKERNLVYLQSTTKTKPYVYDISTGNMIGITGKTLCTIPPCFRQENWTYDNQNVFFHALQSKLSNNTRISRDMTIALAVCEQIAALNNPYIAYTSMSNSFWLKVKDNWSTFCKAASRLTERTSVSSIYDNGSFVIWCETNGIEIDEHITEPMVKLVFKSYSTWSKEKIQRALYYLAKGVYEYHYSSDAIGRIATYFDYCDKLGETPSKGDFMRLYVEAKRRYELRKIEFDNKAIRDYQLAKASALNFEYDDFVVVIPTTSAEIITEGERQSNCVGRLYLPKVIDKERHIVFVRRKDDIDKNFITCEIYNDGSIGQYLLAHNYYVACGTPEDEFKNAYTEHLKKYW